jgi:hypothetical protein
VCSARVAYGLSECCCVAGIWTECRVEQADGRVLAANQLVPIGLGSSAISVLTGLCDRLDEFPAGFDVCLRTQARGEPDCTVPSAGFGCGDFFDLLRGVGARVLVFRMKTRVARNVLVTRSEQPTRNFSVFSMQPRATQRAQNLPALHGNKSRADYVAVDYFVGRWRKQGLSFSQRDGASAEWHTDRQTGEYRPGRGFTLAKVAGALLYYLRRPTIARLLCARGFVPAENDVDLTATVVQEQPLHIAVAGDDDAPEALESAGVEVRRRAEALDSAIIGQFVIQAEWSHEVEQLRGLVGIALKLAAYYQKNAERLSKQRDGSTIRSTRGRICVTPCCCFFC